MEKLLKKPLTTQFTPPTYGNISFLELLTGDCKSQKEKIQILPFLSLSARPYLPATVWI